MSSDRFGLPLSTSSTAAVAAYVDGVDRVLSMQPGAERAFATAIAADDGFALAHVGRARALQIAGRVAEARPAAARARALAAGATRRERQHVEPVALMLDGDAPAALAAVRAHVNDFPRDALVLGLALGAFGLLAFSGRRDHAAEARALLDVVAPRWDADDWWFLFADGWAYTELMRPSEGRARMERSLALRPDNGNAAHGMAHACYEQGAAADGAAFLAEWLPGYDRTGQFHCHLSWHRALFELAQGRADRALELYEENIRPAASLASPLITVTDSASLLWRLTLYDATTTTPLPWSEVSEYAERAFPGAGLTFADLHCAFAAAAAGDAAALARRTDALAASLADGRLPQGPVVPALVAGLAAAARGDWSVAADVLEPAMPELPRIGGSHAQRDLFEETFIVACLRAGRSEPAGRALRARLAHRPSPRDRSWLDPATAPGAMR